MIVEQVRYAVVLLAVTRGDSVINSTGDRGPKRERGNYGV
jgi:hypothetical protein